MEPKISEDYSTRESNSGTFHRDRSTQKPSREFRRPKRRPYKSQNRDVVLHQSRRERIGESIEKKTEILRDIISNAQNALGPLSELIKKLRLLEKKSDIFRYNTRSKNHTKTSDNVVGSDSQRMIESLETERDELSKGLAYWHDKCNELTTYSNVLADDIRRLQSSLDIQSENELIVEFNQLCFNIKNCSDHFEQESVHGKHTLSRHESRDLFASVGLNLESDRYLLKTSTGRKNLSRAYLSRMLVKMVFHYEEEGGCSDGQIKDLWASESTARELAAIENRMKEIGLSPEEFNKWRSMTVRYLTRSPQENSIRVDMLVKELLHVLLGIFGLDADSSSADKLRKISLEDPIVVKAVALSQSLRKQMSNISICIGDSQNRGISSNLSTVNTGEDFPEEEEKDATRLWVSPAMVRNTDEYGVGTAKVYILVPARRACHKKEHHCL